MLTKGRLSADHKRPICLVPWCSSLPWALSCCPYAVSPTTTRSASKGMTVFRLLRDDEYLQRMIKVLTRCGLLAGVGAWGRVAGTWRWKKWAAPQPLSRHAGALDSHQTFP